MLLVDSSVWVDYFNGKITQQTDYLYSSLGWQEVGLGDLILCEVLQGFLRPREYSSAREMLLELPILDIGGAAIALQAADNYRYLRQRGVTIRKTIDCIIATFAIEEGHTLLHNDRDFAPFVKYLGLRTAL